MDEGEKATQARRRSAICLLITLFLILLAYSPYIVDTIIAPGSLQNPGSLAIFFIWIGFLLVGGPVALICTCIGIFSAIQSLILRRRYNLKLSKYFDVVLVTCFAILILATMPLIQWFT